MVRTEASSDLLTLSEPQSKMEEFSESKETYSTNWLKKKLQDRCCNHIVQRSTVEKTCFKNMVNYIINEQWYEKRRNNVEDEAKRIVATAAKLIREEIRNLHLSMECYPSKEEITDSVDENSRWMAYLLSTFLSYVVPDTVKRASMCQCIIKSSRPRTALPPLLFGLGIECDHVFGSKWLVNELYRLGFSISYSEVNTFKKSVAVNHSGENLITHVYPQLFTQFVADNVDHNIRTLDGSGTFHGIGIIAISTPFPGNSV